MSYDQKIPKLLLISDLIPCSSGQGTESNDTLKYHYQVKINERSHSNHSEANKPSFIFNYGYLIVNLIYHINNSTRSERHSVLK